jgi:hypothetical protein
MEVMKIIISLMMFLCLVINTTYTMQESPTSVGKQRMHELHLNTFSNGERVRIWVKERDLTSTEQYRQVKTEYITPYVLCTALMYSVDTIAVEVKHNETLYRLISLYMSGNPVHPLVLIVMLQFQYFNFQQISKSKETTTFLITRNERFDQKFPEHLTDLIEITETRERAQRQHQKISELPKSQLSHSS